MMTKKKLLEYTLDKVSILTRHLMELERRISKLEQENEELVKAAVTDNEKLDKLLYTKDGLLTYQRIRNRAERSEDENGN